MPWRNRHASRPVLAPAIANTAALVLTLLRDWFRMPPPVEEAVLAAVLESRFSRATELKQRLCVAGSVRTNLDHLFCKILVPRFWMDLLRD